MSFAAPRKKSNGPQTQRGNSATKMDPLSSNNKSFEQSKKLSKNLVCSQSQQQLDHNGSGSIGNSISNDNQLQDTQILQATQQINITNQNTDAYTQVLNNKMQRLFDRVGFLEDALSRVELQQDSFRPVLKMLENNPTNTKTPGQKPTRRAQQKENSQSFLSSSNGIGGLMLDKLTKTSTQLNQMNAQNENASSLSNLESSMIANQQIMPNNDQLKEEIEKSIQSNVEIINQEFKKQKVSLQQYQDDNNSQMDNLRQEILTCQDQIQQMITLYQNRLVQSNSDQHSPKAIQIGYEKFQIDQMIKEVNGKLADQEQEFKNTQNCLKAKVDSMDNTYDKRISNLEAVITPLLAQQLTASSIQEQVAAYLSKNLQSLIDDKLTSIQKDGKTMGDVSENSKLREPYDSNLSNKSGGASSQKAFQHQMLTQQQNQMFHTQQSSFQKQQSSCNLESADDASQVLSQPNANTQQPVQERLSHNSFNTEGKQQAFKVFQQSSTEVKDLLEDLEQFILSTSETINEKLEDIQRQMGDLHNEIVANVELVKEKKKVNSQDTKQFVQVLGEDVKQFIYCMKEELEGVVGAISERDDKCKLDMERIEGKVKNTEGMRNQINLANSQSSQKSSNAYQSEMSEFSHNEKKELSKVDAFKEHSFALIRHMENTTNYLQKEVQQVEEKIDEAKQLVLNELSLNLYNDDYSEISDEKRAEQEMLEMEEEDDDKILEEEKEDEEDGMDDDRGFQNVDEANEDDYEVKEEGSKNQSNLENESEADESYIIPDSIKRNQNSLNANDKVVLRNEKNQQTHQSSSSSEKTATLSAHAITKTGAQCVINNSQPFFYPGHNPAHKTPNPNYNIEVFMSNKSEEYYSGAGKDKKQREKTRSISTINDELEPHRAQKSPQGSANGGKTFSRYQKS